MLKDADALGVRTVINPYLPHKARPFASREEIQKAAEDFASWSTQCRAAGKRFGYHIHGQEFGPAPEGTLFDVLAKESGPEVGFEADVFWVTVGGADPVKLMQKYPGRFWFTHLKDLSKSAAPDTPRQEYDNLNVVLGTGKIDIKGDRRGRRQGRRRDALHRGREPRRADAGAAEHGLLQVALSGGPQQPAHRRAGQQRRQEGHHRERHEQAVVDHAGVVADGRQDDAGRAARVEAEADRPGLAVQRSCRRAWPRAARRRACSTIAAATTTATSAASKLRTKSVERPSETK